MRHVTTIPSISSDYDPEQAVRISLPDHTPSKQQTIAVVPRTLTFERRCAVFGSCSGHTHFGSSDSVLASSLCPPLRVCGGSTTDTFGLHRASQSLTTSTNARPTYKQIPSSTSKPTSTLAILDTPVGEVQLRAAKRALGSSIVSAARHPAKASWQ